MAQQSTTGKAAAPAEPEGAVVSVTTARRLVLYLLAFWTTIWGLSLVFAVGAGGLGAGIEDDAAQRLLGVHVLVLALLYGFIAWNPTKYRVFLWVPYFSQAGIILVMLFDILSGNGKSAEGVLPLVLAVIFLALLVFLWQASRKPAGAIRAGGAAAGGSPPATATAPKAQKPR